MHPDYIRALQKKAVYAALVQHLREVYLPQPSSGVGPKELEAVELPIKNNPVPHDAILDVLQTIESHAYKEEQEAQAFEHTRRKGSQPAKT